MATFFIIFFGQQVSLEQRAELKIFPVTHCNQYADGYLLRAKIGNERCQRIAPKRMTSVEMTPAKKAASLL